MKKLVLMGLMVLAAAPAFAKISSKVTATSDFIWRGISASGSGPAIQGGTNYVHDSGFAAGIWASNQTLFSVSRTGFSATPSSYLFNPFVTYGKDIGDFNVSGTAIWYNFSPGSANHNSAEVVVAGAFAGAKLSLNFMPNYFGYETSSLYANLSYKLDLDKDFGVFAAIGYQSFGDDKKTPWGAYSDWKLALQHTSSDGFTAEVGLTDAVGLKLNSGGTQVDAVFTQKSYVSLTKAF